MATSAKAAHISHRVHLSELPEQGGKKLFGLSLCAAPYFEGAIQPPLLGTADHELDPYLPWTWCWRGDVGGGAASPGFRWTLLVLLNKTAGGVPEWKAVPPEAILKTYAKPPGFTDDLTLQHSPPGTAPTPTVHDTWWRAELRRLTLNTAGWIQPPGAAKPLAHARQLERYYGGSTSKSIEIKEEQHDSHADLLGARMLRWATAHPPYNYFNSLTVVLECLAFTALRGALVAAYPTFTVSATMLRIAAVPLWVADGVPPQWDNVDEPEIGTLVVEQLNVPVDGLASATAFRRRSYGNIVDVKPGAPTAKPAGTLAVDLEPWRKDIEDRMARCADMAMLLLDAAADTTFQPVVAPHLVEWVVGLSADLFQAEWQLKANPADPGEWALQLVSAAGENKARLEQAEFARLEAVLPLLPAKFSLRFPQYRFQGENATVRTELLNSLGAPVLVLARLEAIAVGPASPLKPKAQRVLAKIPKPVAAERALLQALHDTDSPAGSLATPNDDLELYRKLRKVIDDEDAATPSHALRDDPKIAPNYPNLARSGEALQGLLDIAPNTDESIRTALHGFVQILRDPQLFHRLRQQVATTPGPGPSSESDHVRVALRNSLRFLVTGGSLKRNVLPRLNEDPAGGDIEARLPVQPLIDGLIARLNRRLDHPTSALEKEDQLPRLPGGASAGPIVTALAEYLKRVKAQPFRDGVYGDRSLPLSRPHGLSIVLNAEEVFDSQTDMEIRAELSNTAGGLLFARAAKVGNLDTTPWLALNTGVLRLRQVDSNAALTTTLLAQQSILDPLRPAVLNQRLSRRADYDNRPLVAASREDALILKSDNRPRPSDARRLSALLDFVFPATGATIPALRYYGTAVELQFCWVELNNACALPEGLWSTHPALLTALPFVANDLRAKGVAVSEGIPYLRRAGIAPVGISATKFLPCSQPHGGATSKVQEKTWPLLPPGIFPLAAELETIVPAGETKPKSPLVLLFPKNGSVSPALNEPSELVQEITLELHRPRTDEDNWERWAGADPAAPLAARVKICAEAHLFRDQVLNLDGTSRDNPWHPNDPALADDFLIIFSQLYPRTVAPVKVGFVRTWIAGDTALYGSAAPYFSPPVTITLERGAAPGSLVQATGTNELKLAEGVVVEMAAYALLPDTSRDRFLDELHGSLGKTVAQVRAGVTMIDTAPPDSWLALEPTLLRVETPHLDLPPAAAAYEALRVSRQGGKVSVSVAAQRAGLKPELFDLVHEVIVQEQIWRWNGKPSMPEDFMENGVSAIALPPAGEVVGPHLAWDGIAFHQREDREHLATICKLPLPPAAPAPGPAPATPEADVLFMDDKESDARALYFRFSALYRSRYFGAWPSAVQAGAPAGQRIDPLWKRYVLPHRLLTPLKKPSVIMVIPLLASGKASPQAGDTAGVIAIAREACFEQAGLAELVQAQLVETDTFRRNSTTGFVEPTGTRFFQAGYDPILSKVALPSSSQPNPAPPPDEVTSESFVQMSGPVGLTFDQGSRDPLIVNSLFFLEIDRARLAAMPVPGSTNPPAAHLFCQIRFRRTIRQGYEVEGGFGLEHPLASPWTEAQWVKFLPDSDLLRPAEGASDWVIKNTGSGAAITSQLVGWAAPDYGVAVDSTLKDRFIHLLCITRHDLDAVGRPATEFHSLHHISASGALTTISPNLTALTAEPRLRARVLQVLAVQDGMTLAPDTWRAFFFPDEQPGVSRSAGAITEDAQLVPQALSAAWPLTIS